MYELAILNGLDIFSSLGQSKWGDVNIQAQHNVQIQLMS